MLPINEHKRYQLIAQPNTAQGSLALLGVNFKWIENVPQHTDHIRMNAVQALCKLSVYSVGSRQGSDCRHLEAGNLRSDKVQPPNTTTNTTNTNTDVFVD
jgi:hypothetical protein